jgi:hypothetical protein
MMRKQNKMWWGKGYPYEGKASEFTILLVGRKEKWVVSGGDADGHFSA